MKDKIFIESQPLALSEEKTYLEATYIMSVLDEYNRNDVLITEEDGELYHDTIVGQPIVASLKYNIFGDPVDFKGHEVVCEKDKDGNNLYTFNTSAIGTVTESWIEEREVEGYNGLKKCIMIKARIWSYRFPKFAQIFMKLWNKNNLKTSWEILIDKSEKTDKGKIAKVFEFIGNCLLGSNVTPAVNGAGVVAVAEINEDIKELTEALRDDIVIEVSEENNKGGQDDMSDENKDKKLAVSSLTTNDLREKIKQAVDGMVDDYFWVTKIYPYEFRAILELDSWKTTNEDGMYKEVKFSADSSGTVTINSITDVEMIFKSKSDVEKMVETAEQKIKDEYEVKVSELETELTTTKENVATLGTTITTKEAEIAELQKAKEKLDEIEAKETEMQLAEQRKVLEDEAIASGYITKEELETSEVLKEAIEKVDRKVIVSEIGTRAMEKVKAEKEAKSKEVETSEAKETVKVDLNADEESTIKSNKSSMDSLKSLFCN